MKKILFVVLGSLLLVSVTVGVSHAYQGLVNGGFEQAGAYGSTDLGSGWSHVNTQYTENDNLSINLLPAAHSGKKAIAIYASTDGEYHTGSIVQTIQLPTGTYNFHLSGWGWVYSTNLQHGNWIRGDLYADTTDYTVGVPGWFGAVGDSTGYPQSDAVWYHMWNDFNSVKVKSGVSLVITMRVGDPSYGPVGIGAALSDDWSVQAKKVQ